MHHDLQDATHRLIGGEKPNAVWGEASGSQHPALHSTQGSRAPAAPTGTSPTPTTWRCRCVHSPVCAPLCALPGLCRRAGLHTGSSRVPWSSAEIQGRESLPPLGAPDRARHDPADPSICASPCGGAGPGGQDHTQDGGGHGETVPGSQRLKHRVMLGAPRPGRARRVSGGVALFAGVGGNLRQSPRLSIKRILTCALSDAWPGRG